MARIFVFTSTFYINVDKVRFCWVSYKNHIIITPGHVFSWIYIFGWDKNPWNKISLHQLANTKYELVSISSKQQFLWICLFTKWIREFTWTFVVKVTLKTTTILVTGSEFLEVNSIVFQVLLRLHIMSFVCRWSDQTEQNDSICLLNHLLCFLFLPQVCASKYTFGTNVCNNEIWYHFSIILRFFH